MSTIPSWLVGLLKDSSPLGLLVLGLWIVYKIFDRLIDSPLSIATIIVGLAGKDRRKDAIEVVNRLCSRDEEPRAVDSGAPPGQPPRWWRRRRRKRRRKGT